MTTVIITTIITNVLRGRPVRRRAGKGTITL